ncbi:hypothetical protein Goklo_024589 [Gossypium klotzschianum]|uniref:Uncharacterized protein n=1 Tax=Gossypium klotzschianum TaxID=34286 RepID=A0A7J8W5M4_9ROSI|nr:hypothetical protein [Gossypium klotzschianum]
MSNAWNQTRRMKILAVGPSMTPDYSQWRDQRVNDNIPVSNPDTSWSLEEHLQVLPSEIEIIQQDFEKRSLDLGKKIEQLEEEKMQLGLDVEDAGAREVALEKSLLVCQNEKAGLKTRVTELEMSLHQHRSRNSTVELKASLSKIEELRRKVGELEDALQNGELRIELLEKGNE